MNSPPFSRSALLVIGGTLALLVVVSLGVFAGLVSYHHYEEVRARQAAERARFAAIQNADDAMREWAHTKTGDPLVAQWHDCVLRLTYTASGGYAEVSDADRMKCTQAFLNAGGKDPLTAH